MQSQTITQTYSMIVHLAVCQAFMVVERGGSLDIITTELAAAFSWPGEYTDERSKNMRCMCAARPGEAD